MISKEKDFVADSALYLPPRITAPNKVKEKASGKIRITNTILPRSIMLAQKIFNSYFNPRYLHDLKNIDTTLNI